MNDSEAIEMMKRCAAEINDLRRQITVLAPKADAYDNMTAIIGLLPKQSQGYAEDFVWRLEKRIEELSRVKATVDQATPTEG